MHVLTTILVVFFIFVHLLLLLGLSLQGAFTLVSGGRVIDSLFAAGFLVVGVLFSVIVVQRSHIYIGREGSKRILSLVHTSRTVILLTLALVLVLVLVRQSILWSLPYVGLLLGSYVITQAHLGILQVIRFDILDYGAAYLAWLGQWYFVYAIVSWARDSAEKLRSQRPML